MEYNNNIRQRNTAHFALNRMVKLSQCLADLGCTASTFENCDNVDDELKVIRKIWTKLVLIQHPVSKLNLEWTIRSIFILK